MKRFLIRQLALVLSVAIMMSMTGLAEDLLLNRTAALSTDADIVAVKETDEEPVEASEIDLPVEEETLVEELNKGNNPDMFLPSEDAVPGESDEDLLGKTDVPADPDTMPLDDVENAFEPVSESSDELDNPDNAPGVTDGENQTSTDDDQIIDPQDQGDTTEPVENEGESQSDGISSEEISTESETVVSDQAFTTESNSEDAVPVIPTEEQILSEEIQFEETELPKLVAAGPAMPTSLTMGQKEKYQLAGGSDYSSSNPKVATVNTNGLIIAKKKGITIINAGTETCQVKVKAAPRKIKLPKKQTVLVGQSIILTAKVSGGASANITWTSSNPAVATVDSSGMVTGISMGKAKITAKTYNKKKATCTVTVESANAPTMVSFPMGTLFVGKGESVQLKPVLNPGAETKFTFTSKNKKVATVNKSSGLLKGKKVKKSTKITVTTHNKKKATLSVKVLNAPGNVTMSIPSATLDIGGAVAVTASLPSKTASQIYWSSDNPGVAIVSDSSPFSDGTNSAITVTAIGSGTATITARTFNGKTASCTISVNPPSAPAPAPAPAPNGGGDTNTNDNDNTGNTPPTPEITEPVIEPIANTNPTQGSPVVISITNSAANQSYKAGIYSVVNGVETLVKEYGLDATGNTITIPTEELSMGDYKVRVTTTSADGSTSKSVDVGEITVEESAELLTPSVSINNTTPKQGAVLTIGIKNADQGKGESYKAVISATEYNKEFVSVDGNKTIEIDTTSIPSGNYSLTVVVSANGNSKETDPVELTIKPTALNDISCTLSMDGGTLASGSTIPQGKTVIVGIDHTGQDLGENYKVKLSGGEGETVYDVPDGYYAIDTTSLEVGTYRVSATVSATDYDSKTSDALSFTVAALAIPTLTLSSSSVALGEQVVVTVSGNQPVEVEYGASIVNVADKSDAAIGMWSGEALIIDTTGLTAGATYKVSVTVSEKGSAGYAPKTAETTFGIPGLEVPAVTITKAAVKQGGALEATITNNDDQPTPVIYSAQIKPLEGDRLDVPCIVNETSLSINTNIGTEDEPTFVSVGKYQLIVIASATGYQSVSTEVGEVFIKPQALPEIDYSLWMDGDVLPSGNSIPHGAGPIVVKINNADQTVGESYQAKLYKLDDAQNEIWSKSYDWDETTRSIELDMINDTGALVPDTYKLIITVSAQDYDAVNTALIDITVTSDFLMEGGVIKGYTGNATEIEIPSKDFDGNVNITVGEGAFKESLLTKVVVPEGITTIESQAFAYSSLQEISLPRSITTIAEDAFEGCGQFKVKVPMNCYAYNWCVSHGYIGKPDPTPAEYFTYATINGLYARITGYTGADTIVVIPEEIDDYIIQKVSDNTFKNNKTIEYVYVPDTVTEIGASAFYGCTSLVGVDVGQCVEMIGGSAFYGCTSLIGADLPDSVVSIGAYAYENCENLTTFHYPMSLTSTGNSSYGYLFKGCKKLESITVPEGITKIPDRMFDQADYTRSIQLPSTLKEIGNSSFRGCSALTELILPDGLEKIGEFAFFNCTYLISAIVPDSVVSIGAYAYENCENLTTFHYPMSLTSTGNSSYGYLFKGCKKLESITVPEGITKIPDRMFDQADYTRSIQLPSTLKEIGNSSFRGCSALTELILPNGLEKIGDYAFYGCSILEKVYMPYSVASIGKNRVFYNCSILTIWTEYGAYALQYAKDNSIPYYYLTPDGVNSPSGTLYKGDSYALYGYARASVPLTNVTATIWDSTGTNVLQTISVNPATTDYSLSGTVNASLLFGNLQLGSYRYTLSARTDVSEEVWVDISFKIVPPPLRIYISGASFPDGLTDVGSGFNITGTVISNYTITKLTISLFTADGVERYTNSVNPGSLTYSLSDLAGNIPIASLPVGDYSIRITAVANGETKILADKSFQPVDLDGEVDEATVQDVVKFVSDNSNASLFPSTYVNSALGRMNASDVLIMAINSRNSWVYGMASTLFTENHENLYLVDLYESELADIIADMNPNTIQLENISSTEKLVADAIMDYGTDILSVFQESSNLNSTTTEFLREDFTELSSKLKRIKDGVKGTKMSIELANNLSKAMCNYVNGLEILTMVSDSMGTNNSPEFKLAVQRMHAKYKSESFNVVMNMLEVFTKELINMSTKEITTAMVNLGSELGSKVNGGMLYSIVNFAIDASMKLTGYSDIADDYQTFMIQVEAYNTGRNTYENAFYAVKGGDTSARAINRLLVAFTYTKQSSLRIHETISNLRSTPTDEMKNILDYTTKLKNTSIAN